MDSPTPDPLMSLGHYLTLPEFQVKTVSSAVNPILELTPYLLKDPARPVFFPNAELKGSKFKVVGNLWATRDRVARSLNTTKEELPAILQSAIEAPVPCKTVTEARFLENQIDVDLEALPIVKYFEHDGGPFITAGIVVARDKAGSVNVSFHRMMTIGKDKFAVRIVRRHLHQMYEEARGDLDVVVAIGLTPAVLLPAAMSVDYGVNELEIASSLCSKQFGSPLQVFELDGIPVPVHSEYVLKGRLTKQQVKEGPFVDITRTYDIVRDQPVLQIDKVYHRNYPIFQALLPGAYEHFLLMGLPKEPVIAHEVSKVVPKVKAVRLTEGGCCWLHGVVSIKKDAEDQGKHAIEAAFKGHRSMKQVIIVDEDIDVFDDRQVEWAVATRFQADRDMVIKEERGSSLDPSRKEGDVTSKVGLDATKPLDGPDEYTKVL